ncbi:MAG: beta-galactosidase [Candidatus Pacebacteria bacterium]|nr:beta-galactosidase [Candidatus Paceibacterota bacterium]
MSLNVVKGGIEIEGTVHPLFSGEVHYWRLETRYWRPILEALKETGMNWVGTYVPWRKHDQGVHDYDFSGVSDERLNLPAFLDLCAELELLVYFRPGPLIVSEMACGGYPDWLGHSGPDYMVWTSTGEVPMGFPGEGNSGRSPSYLHPTYLAHCRRYLEEVNKVVRPYLHQNGGPVKLYQVDNEASLICRDAMFQSDYNPHVVGRGGEYHQWLARKYGDVSSVPYAEGKASFEDIAAPRNLEQFGTVHPMWYFDWAEFKEFIISDYLRRLKQIHLDCGVEDVIFCTNFNPHRPNSMPNNWDRAKQALDAANDGLVGYDFYRGPFLSRTGLGSLDRITRMLSSFFPLPWSAEFMCGFWKEDYSGTSYPYAEHHEFMADTVLAAGLKGISWYMFHDREYWGGSPVSERGQKRYAHQALATIMDVVRKTPDFEGLQETREVGVLNYRPYLRHCFIGDAAPANDSETSLGEPSIDGVPAGRSVREFEGLFQALADAGYHPGVVAPDVNPDDLTEYPVLFACTQSFMDSDTQAGLLAYAENGGTLIMGPVVPTQDDSFNPATILSEVVRSKKTGTLGPGTKLSTSIGDVVCEGEFYSVSGDPIVTAADGQPLVSKTAVGKGTIILVATYITQSDDPGKLGDNPGLLRKIIGDCGVSPAIESSTPCVKATVLKNDKTSLVYLLNHDSRSHEVTVTCPDLGDAGIRDVRGDEVIEVKHGRFTTLVDTKRARVFRIVD